MVLLLHKTEIQGNVNLTLDNKTFRGPRVATEHFNRYL